MGTGSVLFCCFCYVNYALSSQVGILSVFIFKKTKKINSISLPVTDAKHGAP